MLEELEVGVLERLQVGPLRLLADRSMVSRCAKMCKSSPHVLHSLVKVEGELGFAKDILLLLESLCQTLYHLLLCLDFFDRIRLLLSLDLYLALKVLIELQSLLLQLLDSLVLLGSRIAVLLSYHGLLELELLHECFVEGFLLASALQIDALLLVFLHLYTANVRHKTLHEPLNLPIEVNIFMQVLRLRLAIAKVLCGASQ